MLACGEPEAGHSRIVARHHLTGGGGVWHKASASDCLPLAAPIGLSPLTLCASERVLVVSTEPPDDLSCLTTLGVGRPRDGLLPVPLTWCLTGGEGLHPWSGGAGSPAASNCLTWLTRPTMQQVQTRDSATHPQPALMEQGGGNNNGQLRSNRILPSPTAHATVL